MKAKSILVPIVITAILLLISVFLIYLSQGPSTASKQGASTESLDLDSFPKKTRKPDDKTVKTLQKVFTKYRESKNALDFLNIEKLEDKDNAAVELNQVFDIMHELYKNNEVYKLLVGLNLSELELLNGKEKELFISFLNGPEMVKVFELLKQAGEKPGCNFNLQYEKGFSTPLPHLSSIRDISRLLTAKSFLTSKDDMKGKLSFIELGLNLSAKTNDNITVISNLVQQANDKLLLNAIEKNLPYMDFQSEETIAMLDKINNHQIGHEDGALSAYKNETDMLGNCIEKIINNPEEFLDDMPEDMREEFLAIPKGDVETEMKTYYNIKNEIIVLSDSPYYEIKREVKELDERIKNELPFFGKFEPVNDALLKRKSSTMAIYQKTRIKAEIYKYYQDNHMFPNSLNDLGIDSSVTTDPVTGKQFVFNLKDEGFELLNPEEIW